MKKITFLMVGLISFLPLYGQVSNNVDRTAKKMLDNLKSKYDSYKSIEITFDFTIDLPEQSEDVRPGKAIQVGDKYLLDLKDQVIYCDGKDVWVHLVDNNEVQRTEVDPDMDEGDLLTPVDIMNIYEGGEYDFGLVSESGVGNKKISQIEFKPLDPDNEYSKIRLTIWSKKVAMKSIEVFSKDGSRYIIDVKDLLTNKVYADKTFIFDPSKYPGIHIEDLRI